MQLAYNRWTDLTQIVPPLHLPNPRQMASSYTGESQIVKSIGGQPSLLPEVTDLSSGLSSLTLDDATSQTFLFSGLGERGPEETEPREEERLGLPLD